MAVAVLIDWECNLDHALSQCDPQTTFVRLDNPDSTLSSGFNFRYARYGAAPANETRGALPSSRELYKVDGVRYVFLVTGVGRKFECVTFCGVPLWHVFRELRRPGHLFAMPVLRDPGFLPTLVYPGFLPTLVF